MRDSRVYRVRAGEIEIEVEEAGAGERPLVLVHGYTGSRDDFLEVIPLLSDLGRTIAIDQRGHGGSTNSGREEHYHLDALAEDLRKALTALDLPPFDLLGHSMGGMVSLRFLLAHPKRVRSLILMDTVARPFRFVPPQWLETARSAIESGGMAGLYEVTRKTPRPRAPAGDRCEEEMGSERYWERIRVKLRAMDPAAYLSMGSQAFDGVLDRLSEIRCPTTVIVGEQDVFFREPSNELEAGIADARQIVIPEAAHSPQHENRDAWLAAVRGHLARVRG
jgi:pimeloyl-ACP methyl ester carboxylesterase